MTYLITEWDPRGHFSTHLTMSSELADLKTVLRLQTPRPPLRFRVDLRRSPSIFSTLEPLSASCRQVGVGWGSVL